MGTEIQLTIGHVSLDYAKNSMGNDYGFLFQNGDLTRRQSDAVSYEYYKEHPEEAGELPAHEAAFVKPLKYVLPRLQLLGYTLERARREYEALVASTIDMNGDSPTDDSSPLLTFEQFCSLACRYPLSSLSSEYIEYEKPDRDTVAQGRFLKDKGEIDRLPYAGSSGMYWSEASYLSDKMCILSAPAMLQVFGTDPANADVEVIWQFGPLVQAGWASAEDFQPGSTRTQAILVATEGASDARIVRRALDILRPHVADFFRFIDVEERHHFWGTGNLVKFAEGLLRIDIQNQVLFLLDNDAEGVDAHRKLQQLNLSGNMRSMLLPDLDKFRSFPARGPEGMTACDINGRAAAIECYLDLDLPGHPPAQVLWSNYKSDIDAWQGALEHKDSYTRHFLEQTKGGSAESYDMSKLETLLDALISEACLLNGALLPEFD